jgi:TolB protein
VFFNNTSDESQQVRFTVSVQREQNVQSPPDTNPPAPESASSMVLFQDAFTLGEYVDKNSIELPDLATAEYPLTFACFYISKSFCIAENGIIEVLIESDCPISNDSNAFPDGTLQFILAGSQENKYHQLNNEISDIFRSNPSYSSPTIIPYRVGIHWRARYECPMHALFYSQILFNNTNNKPVKVGFTISTQPESTLENDLTAAIPVLTSTPTPQPKTSNPIPTLMQKNGAIAFCSESNGKTEIYLTDTDGHDQAKLTYNDNVDFFPSWSPDGSKIAFILLTEGKCSLSVINSDGTDPAILTTGKDNNDFLFPVWSPDSKKIAFHSNIDGDYEIYTINADGTHLTDLTHNGLTHDVFPSWSPDSQKIAFTSDRNGMLQIYVMNADGTQLKRLIDNSNHCIAPVWSPDGSKIMYLSEESEAANICVMNADGTGNIQLTSGDALTTGDLIGYLPRWSPDSTKIAYLSKYGSDINLNVIDANSSNSLTLSTINSFLDQRPFSWSPDSSRIAFSSEVENEYDIYIINIDGSHLMNLTQSPIDEFCPEWSP